MIFPRIHQHQGSGYYLVSTFKYVLSGWIPECLERFPMYNNLFIVALVEYDPKKAKELSFSSFLVEI